MHRAIDNSFEMETKNSDFHFFSGPDSPENAPIAAYDDVNSLEVRPILFIGTCYAANSSPF